MSVIEVQARYAVSLEQVWAELARVDRHVVWMSDAVTIEFTTPQREGIGTAFRCTTKVGPIITRDVMTITEWVEGTTMGVNHVGLIKGRGSFSLRGDQNATTLTWREQFSFPWWAAGPLGSLFAKPVLARLWAKNLQRLGAVLAANETPSAANGRWPS